MRHFLFLLSLFFVSSFCVAQVHDENSHSIDIGISKTGFGAGAFFGYNKDIKDNFFIRVPFKIEKARVANISYWGFSFQPMGYYNPVKFSDRVLFNAGMGLNVDYDLLSGTDKAKAASGFTYGVIGGMELEDIVSDQIGFFLNGTQTYYFKNNFGQKKYDINIGVRIYFSN
jgi:hypothetical protein